MATITTYSFKSVSGAFNDPLVGNFTFAGQIGTGRFTVSMAVERTAHDNAADGATMVSYLAGDQGAVDIEVQQVSPLHQFLLNWFNTLKSQADQGNPSDWAGATMTLRDTVNQTGHVLSGLSPSKIPDKPYAAQGQRLTWRIMAAHVVNS
jgi:hypothetical protein